MSINWVMLNAQDFVRLPGEKPVYKSPPRIAISITTPKSYPAATGSVSISSDSGTLYLTNQRLVYIPTKSRADFQSFSAPLLKLHDTHLTMPWFGPNAWVALVEPVSGGNLPPASTGIELKLTFKEGGAPDFHSNFERIKERLQQAVETARESMNADPAAGAAARRPGIGFLQGVNMDAVHLDQLPSYEASGHDRFASPPGDRAPPQTDTDTTQLIQTATTTTTMAAGAATNNDNMQQTRSLESPSDAPPGYEETQTQSIQQELDRRLSGF